MAELAKMTERLLELERQRSRPPLLVRDAGKAGGGLPGCTSTTRRHVDARLRGVRSSSDHSHAAHPAAESRSTDLWTSGRA